MTRAKRAKSYLNKLARKWSLAILPGLVAIAWALLPAATGGPAARAKSTTTGWRWELPPGFLPPWVPASNPLTAAKVELGRHLFYDVRLSGNRTQSCASCHQQALAFTDGRGRALGSTGAEHPRGSMSLLNAAYLPRLTWVHPTLDLLEAQAILPLFGEEPVEMGLQGSETRFLVEAAADPAYRPLIAEAFPRAAGRLTMEQVTQALAAFQRSLISFRSPYDRYRYFDDENAIPEEAKRGELLFFSGEKAGCFQCHGDILFGGAVRTAAQPSPAVEFHNTGLYNLQGAYRYPAPNRGLYEHTGKLEDVGKFRAPTLRNVAVTAPYMHDGSIATLEDVLEHYAAGGRTIPSGERAGRGSENPNKSDAIRPLTLNASEKRDLVAFLRSLTDAEALRDPRWSNPWPRGSASNP